MADLYSLSIGECLSNTKRTFGHIVTTFFGTTDRKTTQITRLFRKFIDPMREDLYLVVETNYVDKVYRDSYYTYFSTKHEIPARNCIKVSFFEKEVAGPDFYNTERIPYIKQCFLGFVVIRPTWYNPIGRNVISPRALKENDIRICNTFVETTTAGLKLEVRGFPHSSQDTETMTCAETSVWAIMEYFGNKYSEYHPLLPSSIHKTLESRSVVRQVPSKGLIYEDISYALRSQGFGTVLYSKQEYKDDFKKLFACYVESGIPVVVALKSKIIGHAVICIGRKDVTAADIAVMERCNIEGVNIIEWCCNIDTFVFIDDNMAPYRKASFEEPTKHYPSRWHSCEITHFIVPLYNKIYLEAHIASGIALNIALKDICIPDDTVVRSFLTSSRSYKNYIMKSRSAEITLKDFVRQKELPKFIWVTELSTLEKFQDHTIEGFLILDATEVHSEDYSPFIFACYKEFGYKFSKEKARITKFALSLHPLSVKPFEGNLKMLS